MSKTLLYTIILLGQVVFAATPLFAKITLREIDPLTVGVLRFGTSAIILNIFLALQGKRIIPPKKYWLPIIFLGFLAIPANQGCFLFGLQFTSPGHSALLYSMTPLFALLLAIPLLKERLTALKAIGMLIALGGVLIVLLDRNITTEPDFVIGDLIITAGVITWALFTVRGKPLVQEIGSVAAITTTMTAGAILFLPLGIYNTVTFDYSGVSSQAWIGLAFITFITSAVAYPMWYWALKYMEASKLTVFIFLQPVLASIMSYIFLSEELTTHFVSGGIIVIAGVILTVSSKRRNRPPAIHPLPQSGKS